MVGICTSFSYSINNSHKGIFDFSSTKQELYLVEFYMLGHWMAGQQGEQLQVVRRQRDTEESGEQHLLTDGFDIFWVVTGRNVWDMMNALCNHAIFPGKRMHNRSRAG